MDVTQANPQEPDAAALPEDPALAVVRALVLAMPGPVAVLDGAGGIVAANAAFRLRRARIGACDEVLAPLGLPDGRHFVLASCPDAAERSGAERLLELANALPVMLNMKDRDSRYLMMNRYQAGIYGTTPDAALGRTAAELLGIEYGSYARRIDESVFASARAMPFFEESYPGADGVVRRWLTSKVPMTDAEGEVWAVATVSADITDRVRLEEGLRQAKEEAEAANRARAGFLAAMSHELRTPLNAVNGFAEIMYQQALGPIGNPEYLDYAGHILRSGQHLLALINDVLDFARIESGSLVLNLRPVDLGALLRRALDAMAQRATEAGVTLARDITEQQVMIRADEARLRQVLLNVAGNAVKFTPAGGRISVTMRPDMRGGAVITVADSGIGIAEENLPHIFQPFWQADSGLDRLREGTGIGLPLARELVALHGGRLELESRLGAGTKVTVSLPERPGLPV